MASTALNAVTSSVSSATSSTVSQIADVASGVGIAAQQLSRNFTGQSHLFQDANEPRIPDVIVLLESRLPKDNLQGMTRAIALMSRGRDCAALFPSIVKLVISTNLEVKKLVYVYLTHYAELEPDLALLSINTFQKDLRDANPLIRAQALRVLSSIRLRTIVQIVVLSVRKASTDVSPYVRKTAAHAIPKVFNLDPDVSDSLVEIIETLLADRSTMVLGSAVAAFMEVCPDRWDLIHPHYRKIVQLLANIDEWGQVMILMMLTRYVRTQFLNPNRGRKGAGGGGGGGGPVRSVTATMSLDDFYASSDSPSAAAKENGDGGDGDDDDDDPLGGGGGGGGDIDADHRALLRVAQSLLSSRNNAVVMAVASLFLYTAPAIECSRVGKSLVRIMRSSREVQYTVLQNIATVALSRPDVFADHFADFYVESGDPTWARDLKLEILSLLATESNIQKILREFNSYIRSEDKKFVTMAIHAIGRCAMRLPDVAESCMLGLISLLSNPNSTVVGESVVVLKQLLQMGGDMHDQVVSQLARMLPTTTHAGARASILWAVGEYAQLERVRMLAPDVLRVTVKSFVDESDETKLQVLNLGAKLSLTNPQQTLKLFHHALQLARYDRNYDIRDRARLMRQILAAPSPTPLSAAAYSLFFATKSAPVVVSPSESRQRFLMGTLSHALGHAVVGYSDLPEWTTTPPNPEIRTPSTAASTATTMGTEAARKPISYDPESFYDDDDGEEEEGEWEEYEEYVYEDGAEEATGAAAGGSDAGWGAEEGEEEWEEWEEEGEEEAAAPAAAPVAADPWGSFGAPAAPAADPWGSFGAAPAADAAAAVPAAAAAAPAAAAVVTPPPSAAAAAVSPATASPVVSPPQSLGTPAFAAPPEPTDAAADGGAAAAGEEEEEEEEEEDDSNRPEIAGDDE